MRKPTLRIVAPALACGVIVAAQAQEAQSDLVAAGHEFALEVCANCHVVAKDQKAPPLMKPPAPSFTTLTARGDLTEGWLRSFLATPHAKMGRGAKMPNPQLADFQIAKIVAYVMSLKQGKGGGK